MPEELGSIEKTKKPIFHRWWFWLIVAVILLVIFGYGKDYFDKHRGENVKDYAKNAITGNDEQKFNARVVKTFTPPSGTAFKYASPLLYDEHIYIGTSERTGYDNAPIADIHDNFFYKFDLDFNVVWQYPLQKKMVSGGAVMDSDHNLYFVTELLNDKNNSNKKDQIFSTTTITSLTESGTFRWEKPLSDVEDYWDHAYLTPAISADNIIYVGDDKFVAYDTNGNKLGQYPAENSGKKFISFSGGPVIDTASNVYFTSPEPVIPTVQKDEKGTSYVNRTEIIRAYKFAPKLASVTWSTVMGNEMMDNEGGNPNGGGGQKASAIESSPSLGVDGKVLYGLAGCTISKIDTTSGKLLWSLKPPQASGHFNAVAAVDGSDNLYIGSKSNNESRLYGIKSDGTVLWNHLVGADLYNSPILGDDNTVYVGSETVAGGKFHAINMQTGEQKWAIGDDTEKKIPDFTHDGMLLYKGYVYVGVHSAVEGEGKDAAFVPTLYKIKVDADGYLAGSPWPRMYGGNTNSGRQN